MGLENIEIEPFRYRKETVLNSLSRLKLALR
jgi:hypothetical protein